MIVIDASVLVSSYLEKEKFHRESKLFLDKLAQRRETVLLPEVALPEIASAITRGTGVPEYGIDFCKELRKLPYFVFVPVDELLSDIAVEIASKYFLKGADSIYVALAYRYSIGLITLDEEQGEKASKIIRVSLLKK